MNKSYRQIAPRYDLIAERNPELCEALTLRVADRRAASLNQLDSGAAAVPTEVALAAGDSQSSQLRKALVEDKAHDPNGFERLIGKSSLLSMNYLERGRRTADAVCRIVVQMRGGGATYGTGFLVGPRLLLTNNHVLPNARMADQAEVEFGYQHDVDGVLAIPTRYNLAPEELFFSDADTDFTLVALAELSDTGVPLERFGWLPLLRLSGKAVDGEAISIIQHPKGEPKQLAIHASEIVVLDPAKVAFDTDKFIHYSTDTEPGSSGAPVLNDQWQVVAVHHKAVPHRDDLGKPPSEKIRWVANEGVRISAIFSRLERDRFTDDNARAALDRLARGIGYPPLIRSSSALAIGLNSDAAHEAQGAPLAAAHWEAPGLGYDPDFLSESIPFEPIYADLISPADANSPKAAMLLDGSGHELKYFHYSSVINERRKLPLLTAVNVNGLKLRRPPKRPAWRMDRRISEDFQLDDRLYGQGKKDPAEKVYFDRGHMVRLLDPCWGESDEDAKRGQIDTFHFTNAAPQEGIFNDVNWGNLEDYILEKAQITERKLTVLTGPIFREDDPEYGFTRKGGPWQIPISFWKIAVLQKTATKIAVAAFVRGQTDRVQALYEAKVFTGLKPYSAEDIKNLNIQTTLAAVEDLTGLNFEVLKPFETVRSALEATRWLGSVGEIEI